MLAREVFRDGWGLTANIMDPRGTLHQEDVVAEKNAVESLEHQKYVPRCWSV